MCTQGICPCLPCMRSCCHFRQHTAAELSCSDAQLRWCWWHAGKLSIGKKLLQQLHCGGWFTAVGFQGLTVTTRGHADAVSMVLKVQGLHSTILQRWGKEVHCANTTMQAQAIHSCACSITFALFCCTACYSLSATNTKLTMEPDEQLLLRSSSCSMQPHLCDDMADVFTICTTDIHCPLMRLVLCLLRHAPPNKHSL